MVENKWINNNHYYTIDLMLLFFTDTERNLLLDYWMEKVFDSIIGFICKAYCLNFMCYSGVSISKYLVYHKQVNTEVISPKQCNHLPCTPASSTINKCPPQNSTILLKVALNTILSTNQYILASHIYIKDVYSFNVNIFKDTHILLQNL